MLIITKFFFSNDSFLNSYKYSGEVDKPILMHLIQFHKFASRYFILHGYEN